MTKLRVATGREVCRKLKKLGFKLIRQKGSHTFWRHPDGRATVVPIHKGEVLGRGLLRSILRDIEISVKEFNDL